MCRDMFADTTKGYTRILGGPHAICLSLRFDSLPCFNQCFLNPFGLHCSAQQGNPKAEDFGDGGWWRAWLSIQSQWGHTWGWLPADWMAMVSCHGCQCCTKWAIGWLCFFAKIDSCSRDKKIYWIYFMDLLYGPLGAFDLGTTQGDNMSISGGQSY